jgi:lysophospholipid acyltransferase (LPLAT)-like uncharacterized protein
MPSAKRLLRSDAARRFLCWLGHLYVRFVFWTSRWETERDDIPRNLRRDGKSFIVAFWHGRLLMLPLAWYGMGSLHMLISGHRDGRLIADIVSYFGIRSIAGSSNQGGSGALRAMVRQIRAGDCVGITPDGPDGPAMRSSAGIVGAARLARVPIVPISYATSRRRILNTWDRFHLPLPWSRGIFMWGEPIEVPADLSEDAVETWRRHIEERMIQQTAEADRRVGCEATAPGTLGRDALRAMRRAEESR